MTSIANPKIVHALAESRAALAKLRDTVERSERLRAERAASQVTELEGPFLAVEEEDQP